MLWYPWSEIQPSAPVVLRQMEVAPFCPKLSRLGLMSMISWGVLKTPTATIYPEKYAVMKIHFPLTFAKCCPFLVYINVILMNVNIFLLPVIFFLIIYPSILSHIVFMVVKYCLRLLIILLSAHNIWGDSRVMFHMFKSIETFCTK